jgi:hypothetical protein
VVHEGINDGVDRDPLAPRCERAQEATGEETLTSVADRGYFKGEPIKKCEEAGLVPMVPKTMRSNGLAEGRFDKQDFIYIAADDEYRCPAGERATRRFTTVEKGLNLNVYCSSAWLRVRDQGERHHRPAAADPTLGAWGRA